MSEIWFTSDTHYDHANIIKYCDRPFKSAREMNEALIARFNDRVRPGDTVYHLGDFAFAEGPRVRELRARLHGEIHLIRGNHDKPRHVRHAGFASVGELDEIRVDGASIVLCHYAMRVWNKAHHGALMFYGHSHDTLPGTSRSLDVGVDAWDYAPVSLPEIKARLATLPKYGGGDHHDSHESRRRE